VLEGGISSRGGGDVLGVFAGRGGANARLVQKKGAKGGTLKVPP